MKNCEGCYIQISCVHIKYSEACPCIMCIVKMICREACDERVVFRIKSEVKDDGN